MAKDSHRRRGALRAKRARRSRLRSDRNQPANLRESDTTAGRTRLHRTDDHPSAVSHGDPFGHAPRGDRATLPSCFSDRQIGRRRPACGARDNGRVHLGNARRRLRPIRAAWFALAASRVGVTPMTAVSRWTGAPGAEVGALVFPAGRHRETPGGFPSGVRIKSLAVTYFHIDKVDTSIGAERFHFRVRKGIGWFPLAMAARQTGCNGRVMARPPRIRTICFDVCRNQVSTQFSICQR
jgi:hypothetical protein